MARRLSRSDSEGVASAGHNNRPIPGTPWWVKAFGVVAIVLVLLIVVLHLTGHSPGGQMHAPAANVAERGER